MLGVLATGRGFVPLDASSPTERNRLIAEQSGAATVVSGGLHSITIDFSSPPATRFSFTTLLSTVSILTEINT